MKLSARGSVCHGPQIPARRADFGARVFLKGESDRNRSRLLAHSFHGPLARILGHAGDAAKLGSDPVQVRPTTRGLVAIFGKAWRSPPHIFQRHK